MFVARFPEDPFVIKLHGPPPVGVEKTYIALSTQQKARCKPLGENAIVTMAEVGPCIDAHSTEHGGWMVGLVGSYVLCGGTERRLREVKKEEGAELREQSRVKKQRTEGFGPCIRVRGVTADDCTHPLAIHASDALACTRTHARTHHTATRTRGVAVDVGGVAGGTEPAASRQHHHARDGTDRRLRLRPL